MVGREDLRDDYQRVIDRTSILKGCKLMATSFIILSGLEFSGILNTMSTALALAFVIGYLSTFFLAFVFVPCLGREDEWTCGTYLIFTVVGLCFGIGLEALCFFFSEIRVYLLVSAGVLLEILQFFSSFSYNNALYSKGWYESRNLV